jgi:hypothetical protein
VKGAHGVDLHEISVWDASSRTSIQALWTATPAGKQAPYTIYLYGFRRPFGSNICLIFLIMSIDVWFWE